MARTMQGVVHSDKPDKTIVIAVTTRKTHPIYKKQYSETTKFMVHDEHNEAHAGDLVIVKETRPVSKRKSWSLVEIVKKGSLAEQQAAKDDAEADSVAAKEAEKSQEEAES